MKTTISFFAFLLLMLPSTLRSQELVIDKTFGDQGETRIPEFDLISQMEFDRKGNILIVGQPEYSLLKQVLFRVDSTGIVDKNFGREGFLPLPFDHFSVINMGVDSNDNILITGISMDRYLVVIRITDSGILDDTFGDHGIFKLSGLGYYPKIKSVTLQSDDKIFILGTYSYSFSEPGSSDLYQIRISDKGELDKTFGGKGIIDFKLGTRYYSSLFLREDQSILLAVSSFPSAIVKLKSDGSLDEEYGEDGKFSLTYKDMDFGITQLFHLPDNSLMCRAYTMFQGRQNGYGFKITPTGAFDPAFGENGVLEDKRFSLYSFLGKQPDGKLLMGDGEYLLRMNPDGSSDESFADNGIYRIKEINSGYYDSDLIVQEDGKILLGNYIRPSYRYYLSYLDRDGGVIFESIYCQLDYYTRHEIKRYSDFHWIVASHKDSEKRILVLSRLKLRSKDDTSVFPVSSGINVFSGEVPGSLRIESSGSPVVSVAVTGIDGRSLLRKTYTGDSSIRLHGLLPGVVILRIELLNGEVINSKYRVPGRFF